MRHGYFGRKLSRTKNERRRLFMILMRSLIEHGRIKTTEAKAKAIQPDVDRLITALKSGSSAGRNQVRKVLSHEVSVQALQDMVKTRFSKRNSGYTRVIRLGKRLGDAAEEVYLEFVDPAVQKEEKKSDTKKTSAKKPAVQEAEVVEEKTPVKKQSKKQTKKIR